MLSKLSNRLYLIANGWLILLILAIFVAFLTTTLPALQTASGDTEGLDTKFFYTSDEAFMTIASYTNEGRDSLRMLYLTVDIAYPILYTSILILLTSWIFNHGFEPESRWRKLNIFPLGMAFFDLLENISIVTMLTFYPEQHQVAAWLATVGTIGKYFFFLGSIVLILVGIVKVFLNKFSQPIQASVNTVVKR